MADRVIYSVLCQLDGAPRSQLDTTLAMAELWARHVREPGAFRGRLLVLTNLPDLKIEGVETLEVPFRLQRREDLFVERVRQYEHVPVGRDEQVMQLDLDALVVAPVDRLFDAIRPGALMAACSGLPALAHEQAGGVMSRGERWRFRVRGWDRRLGVSACVTACHGMDWPRLMGAWTAEIERRGNGCAMPLLGDQSFLNAMFLTGSARVRRFPRSMIYHVRRGDLRLDDDRAAEASVLHFPIPNKLEAMRRWSRVE